MGNLSLKRHASTSGTQRWLPGQRLETIGISVQPLAAIGLWLTFVACGPSLARSDEPLEFARVAPIFEASCIGCHTGNEPEGNLAIDALDPDLVNGRDGDFWREVLDRLNFGDMPPESEPELAAEDRELLIAWLVQERRRATLANNPTAHFRRLTRREYELTMQELLGVELPFGNRLPEEGKSLDGFRNDGLMLRMSPRQYETYLQIADEGLAEVIVSGPPPEVQHFRFAAGQAKEDLLVETVPRDAERPGKAFDFFAKGTEAPVYKIWRMPPSSPDYDGTLPPSAVERHREAAYKLPPHSFAIGLHHAFRQGEALVRVRVARLDSSAKESVEAPGSNLTEPAEAIVSAEVLAAQPSLRSPILTVALGSTNRHGVELQSLGEPVVIDHTDFREHVFRVRMENMPLPNVGESTKFNATVLAVWNSARALPAEAQPPRMKVDSIEFEFPYLESWPPATHSKILVANANASYEQHAEPNYARSVISKFAERAYRRPVEVEEVDRLMQFWGHSRQEVETFEESIRETLGVVLAAPQFLSLTAQQDPGGATEQLDDYELASRLSYFLWSRPPDETLVELAARLQLSSPDVLVAQTQRMLQDPRAWEFMEQFTEQWLELDRLQRVIVNPTHYPTFDDELGVAMRLETVHYLADILRSNASVLQILDSNFIYVNDLLAEHYGLDAVVGPHFRRVELAADHHRGGVMTHASVLTGTSDGTDGHPIKRGMWLLRNLLDERPPPPPPTVPELDREDPDVRDLTMRQALAVHRDSAACAGCHRKIDPWGIAFEEYDAVGNWQRAGTGAELRQRRTEHPVDAAVELPGGVAIDGMRDLKTEFLRTKHADFRRALSRKMLSYALGRSLTLYDQEAADLLAQHLPERGDGLGTLVELITASETFQSK